MRNQKREGVNRIEKGSSVSTYIYDDALALRV
jgi:hypothetical protein